MKKELLLIGFVGLIVLFSGCTQQTADCGNGTCDAGETLNNCPEDCTTGQPAGNIPVPPNPEGNGAPPVLPF